MFPNKIVKLKKKREELSRKIKHFVKKYIGEVDERYKKDKSNTSISVKISEESKKIKIKDEKMSKKLKKKIAEEIDRFYVNFNIINSSSI
jgi:hypothetical protein